MLDPGGNEGIPDEILHHHLVVAEGSLAVWSRYGLMIAYKPDCEIYAETTERQFIDLVTLAGDVTAFANRDDCSGSMLIDEAERLTKQVAQTRYRLTLPENRPLARFFETTGLGELLHTVRDLNITVAERVRNQRLDEQSKDMAKHTHTIAHVQTSVEWLEIFIIAVYTIEAARFFVEQYPNLGNYHIAIVFGIAILVAAVTAGILRPQTMSDDHRPIIIVVSLLLLLALGIGVSLWFKPAIQQNTQAGALEHKP
jgi:hypothetical protein